jgi:hypothetical protein
VAAQRSWALTGKVAMLAAFAGLAVSFAVSSAAWLPFLVILAVAGFTYLMGLSTYGVGEKARRMTRAPSGASAHHSVTDPGCHNWTRRAAHAGC